MIFFHKTYILILLLFFSVQSSAQQKNDFKKRAESVFNLSNEVTWKNESRIDTFIIGVFSSEKLFTNLKKTAETKKIKRKPVKIIHYKNYEDIHANQIVYISRNENAYLGFVYQKLKGKNVLIITNQSKQPEYSIINFSKTDTKNSKPYSINSRLAAQNHIKFSKQLIQTGGNKQDIQKLYTEKNQALLEANTIIQKQNTEIDSLKNVISELIDKIKALDDLIGKLSDKIEK